MRVRIEMLKTKLVAFVSTNPKLTAVCVIGLIIAFLCMVMIGSTSCSTRHYFSINAEEITNPNIQYKDSAELYIPF